MDWSNLQLALTYDDVLLVPQHSNISSRQEVNLETQITPKIKLSIPIIAINMDTVTGSEMAEAMSRLGAVVFYPRFKPPEVQAGEIKTLIKKEVSVIPAIGVKEGEKNRAKLLVEAGAQCLTIDVAHGHLQASLDMVSYLKRTFSGVEVIAGVVGTHEGARDLFLAGADAVRVGVGPGTICTTRIQTGCGMPQITATAQAYRAAREMGKIILTDGGTKSSGDIVKALAAGANAVVVGSQLAGTDESPGATVVIDGQKYKEYNGSTSKKEKLRQVESYAKDKTSSYVEHVEGVEAYVRYKGPVAEVIKRLEAGIRSGLSYCGAKNIDELHEKAQFVRVSPIGAVENGSHGVVVK